MMVLAPTSIHLAPLLAFWLAAAPSSFEVDPDPCKTALARAERLPDIPLSLVIKGQDAEANRAEIAGTFAALGYDVVAKPSEGVTPRTTRFELIVRFKSSEAGTNDDPRVTIHFVRVEATVEAVDKQRRRTLAAATASTKQGQKSFEEARVRAVRKLHRRLRRKLCEEIDPALQKAAAP